MARNASHHDSLGPATQRCRQSSAVDDAAGSKLRYVTSDVDHGRDHHKGTDHPGVSPSLAAPSDDDIGGMFDGQLRLSSTTCCIHMMPSWWPDR